MHRAGRVRVIIAVFAIFVVCFAGVAVSANQVETVKGVAVEMNPDTEQTFKSELEGIVESEGLSADYNVALVYTEEGQTLVVTDEEIETGEVWMVGSEIASNDDIRIFHASSVNQIEVGDRIGFQELVDSPQNHSHRLNTTNAFVTSVPYLLDASNQATYRTGMTVLATPAKDPLPIMEPGRLAEQMTVDGSGEVEGTSRAAVLSALLLNPGDDSTIGQVAEDTIWAMRGNATVDVAPIVKNGEKQYYVTDIRPESSATLSPSELRENGEEYHGEVVEINGVGAGARISTQAALSRAGGCGRLDAVMVSGVCVPIPTDVTVHAGLIADESGSEGVVYTGASNIHSSSVTEMESGEYEIVGRVVDAREVDPRLNVSTAIIVYNRERTGDASVSGLQNRAEEYVDTMRSQITMSESEWDEAQATPVPTATPTPTATPSPTSSPTETELSPTETATESINREAGDYGDGEQRDGINQGREEPSEDEGMFGAISMYLGVVSAIGTGVLGGVTMLEVTFDGNANRKRLYKILGGISLLAIVAWTYAGMDTVAFVLLTTVAFAAGAWSYLGVSWLMAKGSG